MMLGDGSVADVRRRSTPPTHDRTTGDIAAMALYAGMGVGAVTGRKARPSHRGRAVPGLVA